MDSFFSPVEASLPAALITPFQSSSLPFEASTLSHQGQATQPPREVFVVFDDAQKGLAGLSQQLSAQGGVDVRYLSADQDLNTLLKTLDAEAPEGGFDAIHLLSHGGNGDIRLGRDQLTGANLHDFSDQLRHLGELIAPQGDLLIYGCDVGQGDVGRAFIDDLAMLTDADVAASDDTTGVAFDPSAQDWNLEVTSGDIDIDRSSMFTRLGWQGALPIPLVFSGLKFLGEVVAGAFAGYAVEQLFTSDQNTDNNSIVLQFPVDSNGNQPAPVNTGIQPGTFVKEALYLDSTGDLVDIRLTGAGSFKLSLAGGLSNLADGTSLQLKNTTNESGLSISVTPIQQSINAGSVTSANSTTGLADVSGIYNRMYSPGYTNLDRLFSGAKNAAIGSIEMTAAIVNDIDLDGYNIGSLELDTGYTTLVDRVNTTTLSNSSGISTNFTGNTVTNNTTADGEIIDFSIIDDDPTITGSGGGGMYRPTTGLIDLGNLKANNLERLIINGSISAPTGDPNDKSVGTNDIRGVITIKERLGSIQAIRSRLDGTVQAGSIGRVRLGRIDGTVTTTDGSQPLTLTLPANFSGFIQSAGHLNMAYTFYPAIGDPDKQIQSGPTIGRVISEGGVSGITAGENDPIYVPSGYNGIVENNSTAKGIASILVNGTLGSRWISKSSIGAIRANRIASSAVIEANGNIGSVKTLREVLVPQEVVDPDAVPTVIADLEGSFISHTGNIGNIESTTGISADFLAGGTIGDITALTGGIQSTLISAKQDIGQITVQSQEPNSTKVVSQEGSIKGLKVYSGTWAGVIRAGKDIGNIYVEKGALDHLSLAAEGNVGDITVKGSSTIVGGTYTAGESMGKITAKAARGVAIQGALFQAGDEDGRYIDASGNEQISNIAGFVVEAHGATLLPTVEPGIEAVPPEAAAHGLQDVQILAGSIGAIRSKAWTGRGITDSVIHAKAGDIAGITGIGNSHGLYRATVVAQHNLGNVKGISQVQGEGILESRFNANEGAIGMVSGQGGVAGGHGINDSTFQAAGEIMGLKGTSNANQGDAIRLVDARAAVFGTIEANVLGGKGGEPTNPLGGGIVESEFKGYADTSNPKISYADDPTKTEYANPYFNLPGIDSIKIDVRSIYGKGIDTSIFDVKGGVNLITSRAFGGSAIFDSEFTAQYGDFKQIAAESFNGGNAIDASLFNASNGSIGSGELGLTAKAGGLAPGDVAIQGSTFEADADIGIISATSKGGAAIAGSSFEADTNFDNEGRIASIKALSKGENIAASTGIEDSTFVAAHIGTIKAEVEDFDGGAAISGSTFTARTATYDDLTGSFNNEGSIGNISVINQSRVGNGIESSKFLAGAAGKIGDIFVDVISSKLAEGTDFNRGASGRAIHLSEFRASALDPDQTALTGSIGTITIKAGRVIPEIVPAVLLPPNRLPPNDQATLEGSGINASYFAAYGKIGNISVDSIGTGVFGSAFLSNSDPLNGVAGILANSLAQKRGPGNIAGISVKASGIYASGTLLSLFAGASIDDVVVEANGFPIPNPLAWVQQLNNLANLSTALQSGQILPIIQAAVPQLLDFLTQPVAVSSSPVTLTGFVAMKSNIGAITIKNTSLFGNYPFLGSLVYARGSYGPVTTTPVAIKAPADALPESYLTSLGFVSPNVFTIYPLPTTFLGRAQAGGNLPASLRP